VKSHADSTMHKIMRRGVTKYGEFGGQLEGDVVDMFSSPRYLGHGVGSRLLSRRSVTSVSCLALSI